MSKNPYNLGVGDQIVGCHLPTPGGKWGLGEVTKITTDGAPWIEWDNGGHKGPLTPEYNIRILTNLDKKKATLWDAVQETRIKYHSYEEMDQRAQKVFINTVFNIVKDKR